MESILFGALKNVTGFFNLNFNKALRRASFESLQVASDFFIGSNPVMEEISFPALEQAGLSGDAGFRLEFDMLRSASFASLKTSKGEFAVINNQPICISFLALETVQSPPVQCTVNATCACKVEGCQVRSCPKLTAGIHAAFV